MFDLDSVILSSIGLTFSLVLVLLTYAAYQQRELVLHLAYGLLTVVAGLVTFLFSKHALMYGPPSIYGATAATTVALGLNVFINGIRLSRGYRVYRYGSLLVVTAMLTCNAIMLNLNVATKWVILSKLAILIWVFSYGARSLIGHGKDLISNVFWLSCSLFSAASLLLAYLALKVMIVPESDLQSFSVWPVHAYIVNAITLALMTVTCLMLLVMHIRAQAGLQAIATLDSLTGALNRRGLQEAANRMQAVSQRIRIPMGMLIVDLDYFKKVNDVYGHMVGDVVLKACVANIRAALRGGDVLGRYGGEEFCILMPNTGEQDATILAERIRRLIESTPVSIAGVESMKDTQAIKCTVSVGAVSSETVGYKLDGMFAAADQNLYKAKKSGRNRIVSNIDQLLDTAVKAEKPAKRHASLIS